ncbi:MAG: hypothetical protein AB7N76_03115 [Planctomycetota bacterium]
MRSYRPWPCGACEAEVEADLAGTTGLPQTLLDDRLSRYCMKRARGGAGGVPAEEALRALLLVLRARHVVMSYTEEGVLDRDAVTRAFAAAFPGFDAARDMLEVEHQRFRSTPIAPDVSIGPWRAEDGTGSRSG